MNLFFLTTFSIFLGCTDKETEDKKPTIDLATVQKSLKGDLAKAESANKEHQKEFPDDPNVLTGAAYLAAMRGEPGKAGDLLRKAEKGSGDVKSLYLRQAIVAIKAGDSSEVVRDLADKSGTNYGNLLCAEIDIMEDEDPDAIKERLEELQGTEFEEVAQRYIALLDREDGIDLAVAHAGWALGKNYGVVLSNFNLGAEILDGSNESDAQMLLVWAGRAIQEKNYDMAGMWMKKVSKQSGLLEERRIATKAILHCLKSPSSSNCEKKISRLKISSGLKHATKLTSARGLIESNPSIAKKLLEGTKGATSAYYWYQLGDVSKAEDAAEETNVLDFLE
ncbi:MAG: hypothetical protein CL916_00985 [Deltaproteobacteria bacterium]|nr:hypothetical protein [Deltaproteobacteria bacterium]